MDGQDADRVGIGLGALDVAIVGELFLLVDPAAQLRDQLVQIAARPRDLLEQQLDQVPRVDERALAAAEHERALGEAAVLDEPAEQRLVLAPRGERGPVEQPRDQRMVVGRIDDPHQLGPRHVEEPRAQRAHAGHDRSRGAAIAASTAASSAASRVSNSLSLSTSAHGSPRARSAAAICDALLVRCASAPCTWPSENGGATPRLCHTGGAARSRSISAPIARASASRLASRLPRLQLEHGDRRPRDPRT